MMLILTSTIISQRSNLKNKGEPKYNICLMVLGGEKER
jgi:hypothetical protein